MILQDITNFRIRLANFSIIYIRNIPFILILRLLQISEIKWLKK